MFIMCLVLSKLQVPADIVCVHDILYFVHYVLGVIRTIECWQT